MDDNRLTTDERKNLRKLIETYGEPKIVQEFGVSTESLLRALADMPMRRGTVLMVRTGLQKMVK